MFSGSTSGEGLNMVTSVEVSQDGRFLYASAWRAATITVFERDADSGELTEVQKLVDAENLQGATALRLSPDGRMAVASAFSSKTTVLYRRDADTGKLTRLDVATQWHRRCHRTQLGDRHGVLARLEICLYDRLARRRR